MESVAFPDGIAYTKNISSIRDKVFSNARRHSHI
jgi:hypothetical protein